MYKRQESLFEIRDSINEYSYLLRNKGPISIEKDENLIIMSTGGDGVFLDNKCNSYPIDGGSIPCVSCSLIEGEEDDSSSRHQFYEPFECNWFKNGGYIQYGDVWIQTDEFDNFFLPTFTDSILGKAALAYGKKFCTMKCFSNKDSESSYWWKLYEDMEMGNLIDKTVKEIYSNKSSLVTHNIDPNRVYENIVANYGLNRTAEAFYKIFADQLDLDKDEIELKLLLCFGQPNVKAIEIPEITKLSSLNLEKHPEIVKDRLEAKITAVMSEVGSKLRKELWPEGQVAADYWNEMATTKEKEGDQAYTELPTLMARLHMREMSGDSVFKAGQKFDEKERYRIYKDMSGNCMWFVSINQNEADQ